MKTVLFAYIAAFVILCVYAVMLIVRVSRLRNRYLNRGDR
jgi:hypothetical protein